MGAGCDARPLFAVSAGADVDAAEGVEAVEGVSGANGAAGAAGGEAGNSLALIFEGCGTGTAFTTVRRY